MRLAGITFFAPIFRTRKNQDPSPAAANLNGGKDRALHPGLHDPSIDAKHEFLTGYGLSEREVRAMARVFKAINIVNDLPSIENAVARKDTFTPERYRTWPAGALSLHSL